MQSYLPEKYIKKIKIKNKKQGLIQWLDDSNIK